MAHSIAHAPYSPSKLGLVKKCPGRVQLELTLPEIDDSSNSAAFGTLAHKVIEEKLITFQETRDFESLNTSEIKNHKVRFLVDRCFWWLRNINLTIEGDIHTELQLSVLDSKDDPLTYGFADLVLVDKDKVTVVDWKFYNNLLDEDNARLQILAYLVGAMQAYGRQHGRGFLYLPILDVDYVIDAELAPALDEIEPIIRQAEQLNAPRIPGDWCRWCKAISICPEFREQAEQLALTLGVDTEENVAKTKLKERYDGQLKKLAESGQFEKIKTLVELLELVQPAYDAARNLVKDLILAGHEAAFDSWEVKRKNYRKVTNIKKLYEVLSPILSDDEFSDSVSASWGKLEDHYMHHIQEEALKYGKKIPKREAKELLASFLGPDIVDYSWRVELRKKR